MDWEYEWEDKKILSTKGQNVKGKVIKDMKYKSIEFLMKWIMKGDGVGTCIQLNKKKTEIRLTEYFQGLHT